MHRNLPLKTPPEVGVSNEKWCKREVEPKFCSLLKKERGLSEAKTKSSRSNVWGLTGIPKGTPVKSEFSNVIIYVQEINYRI